jgi:Family of unknown function (DUF5329)
MHYAAIPLIILSLCALSALADVPESQKHEVEHLLEFVESTKCTFERNGRMHSGEEASKHINRKYKHYRDQITSTEEFIEYAATKSSMSGKDYLVYCETDTPVKSKDWLLEELRNYRQNEAI